MNRVLTYIVLAATLLASCSTAEPEAGAPVEIAFSASVLETKGMVTGGSLTDSETGWRTLTVSSFLHAQSGLDENYFVAETFSYSAGAWHRSGSPVYWPMGGQLDILAYSSKDPFSPVDETWGTPSAAERVRLHVDEHRRQDDILYGACSAATVGAGGASSLSMYHTQAWVEARLKIRSGVTKTVKVEKVEILDVFLGGVLTIENNYGYPRMDWDFRRFTAKDAVLDDTHDVYGTTLTTTAVSVGMLVPQQDRKSLRVTYTVDGDQRVVTRDLAHASWLAGSRYVYEFEFNPS